MDLSLRNIRRKTHGCLEGTRLAFPPDAAVITGHKSFWPEATLQMIADICNDQEE